jgi:mRNA-degrading endonuclease toxin of MazEF toxin-antitoxin module
VETKLTVGRIVWAELYDPQGSNPKVRPAVLLSPGEAGDWLAVAVSTQTDMAPAEVCVELPWHRSGHPRTKLTQRNVAVCTWRAFLKPQQILNLGGIVPVPVFQRIMSVLVGLMGAEETDGTGTPPQASG